MNPVRELRHALGLSVAKFASALGVGIQAVYSAESGVSVDLTPGMRSGLLSIGFDPDVLSEKYRAYREAMACENKAKVIAAVAGLDVSDAV